MTPRSPVPVPENIDVLLLEDSETSIALIRESMSSDPRISLRVAKNLAEARAMLAEKIPDVVVADLMLPDGKGTELLPADRNESVFPMVVLTGSGNEEEAVEAMKAGALDYLVKSEETLTDVPHIVRRTAREWSHMIERKRTEEALRESEERFRTVFTTAAAGMIISSPDGRILQANPAFCGFVGRTEEELLKLTVEDVTHPDDRDLTSLHYGDIFARKRRHINYEKRYLRKDGQTLWGHASVSCVMNAEMKPTYCVGLVQDITARKQMEEELRKANRELDAFVHTVSHDLRSPLTPIIGYTDFLTEEYGDRLDQQAIEILAEVNRQGHRMLRLLEDLLALATVGHLERPSEPEDSRQVVDEVLSGFSHRLMSAGMEVRTDLLPKVRIPRTALIQLFDNLVGNALRYAGKEGERIEIGGKHFGKWVTFYVRDHGPGIPEDERSRVFDLFYRGSTGKNTDGTGVGLATVQKIAHLYGGRAWVEETPGGGCTFLVEMLDESDGTGSPPPMAER